MDKITEKLVEDLLEILPGEVFSETRGLCDRNYNLIISSGGDVSWESWHNKTLTHDYFKFDCTDSVYIITEEQAEEFKTIVVNFYKNNVWCPPGNDKQWVYGV